jgi:hypothetical protein
MLNDIFLLHLGGYDFSLCIGRGELIGNYLHRCNKEKILGVLPLSGINLDDMTDDNLPVVNGQFRHFVPHNVEEINNYLSLYKLAFREAQKYLILQ